MKNEKTCIGNTKVYPLDNNLFRVVIPFNDGSSFQILIKLIGERIELFTYADRFIFNSLSEYFQNHIKSLCKKAPKEYSTLQV